MYVINPQRACAATVTVVVVCVLSIHTQTPFTSHESLHKQYHVFSIGYGLKNMWCFLLNCSVRELRCENQISTGLPRDVRSLALRCTCSA